MIFQVALNHFPQGSNVLACQVHRFCASLQCTCTCLFSGVGIAAAELSMTHHTVSSMRPFWHVKHLLCKYDVMRSDHDVKDRAGLDDS